MANVIRDLVIKVSVDADTKGFDEVDSAQKDTQVGAVALGGVIANLTTKLLETAVAAAKAGAAMAADLVFGATAAADAVAKNSKQLGVNAQQLQRLSGAAALSGADVADLDKGVRALTKGLADAELKGTGPVADGLETLGLEVDSISSLLQEGEIESALGLIGDAFNETEDSAERSAALMQIFGAKAGSQLRPLLEEGTEGIGELGDQIKNVISDDDLAQFEELADKQFLAEDQAAALKTQLAAGLAPAAGQVIDRISQFVEENEELITQDLPVFLGAVGDALIDVTEFTIETVESWREFIKEIDNAAERFEQDFPGAVGVVSDALMLVDQVATDVSSTIREMVEAILDAVASVDALSGAVQSVRAGLGLDEEATGERGGATFLGGGQSIVRSDQLTPDNSAQDLQRIVDGNFAPEDKQIARGSLQVARRRESLEIANAERVKSDRAAEGLAAKQDASAARARRRAGAGRRRASGGGGGGRGAAKAEEASIDDLIGGAIGAATGGPSKVGGDALAGTLLVNVDQSVSMSIGPVTIELPDAVADVGSPAELGTAIADAMDSFWRDRMIQANDFGQARGAVGGG